MIGLSIRCFITDPHDADPFRGTFYGTKYADIGIRCGLKK
jgi:hypothetical protein